MQNKSRLVFGLIFILLVLSLTGCSGTQSAAEPAVTPPAISVQITKDYCPSIEIQPGMQIAWTNQDTVDRVLIVERKDEQGNVLDSGGTDLLQPGVTFTISLIEPGPYTYYCSKDRADFGIITVLP